MLLLVIGQSGAGKTSAIRNLDPDETFIISIAGKTPPIKGAASKYSREKRNLFLVPQPANTKEFKANIEKIFKTLEIVNATPKIKYLIVDDIQYFTAFEVFARAGEKGYQKYTEIATRLVELLRKLTLLRDDLNVALTWHEEVKDTGVIGAKTAGKMIDSSLTVEGLFNNVVRAVRRPTEFPKDNGYSFVTNEEGSTCKLPYGVFDTDYVPNDFNIVFKALRAYENGEDYNWEDDYKPTKKVANEQM